MLFETTPRTSKPTTMTGGSPSMLKIGLCSYLQADSCGMTCYWIVALSVTFVSNDVRLSEDPNIVAYTSSIACLRLEFTTTTPSKTVPAPANESALGVSPRIAQANRVAQKGMR
jgi:hypothetical protein